jgi:MFS family permease
VLAGELLTFIKLMTELATTTPKTPGMIQRSPFYYGWVNMMVAAVAMVGTLPGRTQGLGLVTEPLLRNFSMDRVGFAQINLWATLLGSLFCLGFGRLLDRYGSRSVMALVVALLGAVVVMMSHVTGMVMLFLMITLTRGFGQSALSVASLSLVGQWFGRRLNKAMGVYSVIVSVGFMLSFPVVGWVVSKHGWRVAWSGIGWLLLLVLVPLVLLLVRRNPESCGAENKEEQLGEKERESGYTFLAALKTPAFWVFAIASSTYNLIISGIGLFNESILNERGFDASVYHQALAVTAITSLAGNFLGGWIASKWSANRLMTLAMGLLVIALLALPFLNKEWQVFLWATFMGLVGGFVIVIFFSFWSANYGRRELGRIQGAAQMMTVLASALGPLLLAQCVKITESYVPVFYILSVVVAICGVAAWMVKLPKRTGS